MEIRQFQTNELLALDRAKLESFYYIRSGRLQLMDKKRNVIAQYGPKMLVGLSEYLEGTALKGDLVAFGSTRVVVVEKEEFEEDVKAADPCIKRMLAAIFKTISRRSLRPRGAVH